VTERNELATLSRYAAKMFKLMSSLRARHGIEFDELLIFFALGRLNFDQQPGNLMFVKPANIVSLSDFMDIPRETLRRKLLRLEEKELVQRTSYGFVVKDLASWKRISELSQPMDGDA
jgi:DNA-binding MarR family transcriptional regulator